MSLSEGIFLEECKKAIACFATFKKPFASKAQLQELKASLEFELCVKNLRKGCSRFYKNYACIIWTIFNLKQSAYREGYSTESALLSVSNNIHLNMANWKAIAMVLLDLSAAFDTTDHGILLLCLSKRFDIGGLALRWFTLYLLNRTKSMCQSCKTVYK